MSTPQPTLASLAEDLSLDRTTSRKLVEACLARIADAGGEGSRAFILVDAEAARAAADDMDLRRKAGKAPTRYAGIPISIKDLADIEGQVTKAGSRALADAPPAKADAPVVARLRQAGFIIIGRTNMTEFAYSGLGINPHYGTPRSPYDRAAGRVPGGSSSGAAVSVADGMAHGALGTDTGGSCRIPGSLLRHHRLQADRAARADRRRGAAVLHARFDRPAGAHRGLLRGDGCRHGRGGGANGYACVCVSRCACSCRRRSCSISSTATCRQRFEAALSRLAKAGARITRAPFPTFDRIAGLTAKGGFSASESYAWHRRLIDKKKDTYDPRVLARIVRGAEQSAADYIDLLELRRAAIADFGAAMASCRCARHADHTDHSAAHRRARKRRRIHAPEHADPAQHADHQHPRRMLDLAADERAGQRAVRPDAELRRAARTIGCSTLPRRWSGSWG